MTPLLRVQRQGMGGGGGVPLATVAVLSHVDGVCATRWRIAGHVVAHPRPCDSD